MEVLLESLKQRVDQICFTVKSWKRPAVIYHLPEI